MQTLLRFFILTLYFGIAAAFLNLLAMISHCPKTILEQIDCCRVWRKVKSNTVILIITRLCLCCQFLRKNVTVSSIVFHSLSTLRSGKSGRRFSGNHLICLGSWLIGAFVHPQRNNLSFHVLSDCCSLTAHS